MARGPGLRGAPEPIAALNRVTILERSVPWTQREPLVDIRAYCPGLRFAERICPFLRVCAADRLKAAVASLPPGFHFKIGTALRTLAMQKGGWDRYMERMRSEHPDWPLSALRRATNKYFAPYDQKAPPGHCTGGAVDVVLVDAAGEPLDVTSPTKGWEAAYTWSDLLAIEAKANRMVMVEAMLSAGFSNCRDEYWHYSYGDSAWAVRTGQYECPYGWAHPPVCLETDFEGAAARDMSIESVRDYDGRAIEATGQCAVPTDADGAAGGFAVGLYWARGVPVTLRIDCGRAQATPDLYAGPSLNALERLDQVTRDGEVLTARLTPAHDRIAITNRASLCEEERRP
ncbi:MAG TPA: M15 family metallopeptidase [Chthonomonadaceae bacterium]|nr:M15 family metallopeptidase [Chthonomonadaceae bacterium]